MGVEGNWKVTMFTKKGAHTPVHTLPFPPAVNVFTISRLELLWEAVNETRKMEMSKIYNIAKILTGPFWFTKMKKVSLFLDNFCLYWKDWS